MLLVSRSSQVYSYLIHLNTTNFNLRKALNFFLHDCAPFAALMHFIHDGKRLSTHILDWFMSIIIVSRNIFRSVSGNLFRCGHLWGPHQQSQNVLLESEQGVNINMMTGQYQTFLVRYMVHYSLLICLFVFNIVFYIIDILFLR